MGRRGARSGLILTVIRLAADIVAEERSQLISWCLAGGTYDLASVSIPKLERSYIGYSSQYESSQYEVRKE